MRAAAATLYITRATAHAASNLSRFWYAGVAPPDPAEVLGEANPSVAADPGSAPAPAPSDRVTGKDPISIKMIVVISVAAATALALAALTLVMVLMIRRLHRKSRARDQDCRTRGAFVRAESTDVAESPPLQPLVTVC